MDEYAIPSWLLRLSQNVYADVLMRNYLYENSSYSVIVRVRVVLKRTADGDLISMTRHTF